MDKIKSLKNQIFVSSKKPIRVVVTGAAGNIGYALVFMIAQGNLLGHDQPIELVLLEIPPMLDALKGVEMELIDTASPLLSKVESTCNSKEAFKNCQIALLVGAKPRSKGMVRKDLLQSNAKIFQNQAKDLDEMAHEDCKILVVGNPANTNAMIIANNSKRLKKENITALTRLDQNRAMGQIAMKNGVSFKNVRNVIIWGNHSLTQYPDVQSCQILKNGNFEKVQNLEMNWLEKEFIPRVQKRGAEIIKWRKFSSAASAANAVCDHIRSWFLGTNNGEIVSMGVWSNGNPYDIEENLIFSFPVTCKNGKWEIVQGMNLHDDFSRQMIQKTQEELMNERKVALEFLGM